MSPVNRFETRAAPGVRRLAPYVPGKPPETLERELGITGSIKLASSENPLGPGASARAALVSALGRVGMYPDGSGHELRSRIASRHGLELGQVTLGNGSNDILVDYRLRQKGGTWRIIDVVIEGVSLVSNFRSQFQDIVSNGGPDRLLVLLKQKNASGEPLVKPTPT